MSDNTRIDPMKWIGKIGVKAQLFCQSSKTYWFFGSKKSKPINEKPELVIPQMSLKYNGVFYCYGTYKNNKKFIAEMEARVYGQHIPLYICSCICI